MRIAQVSTSSGPVREDQTGSVEALVWLLSRELAAVGHEVTIFGCEGSEPPPGVELIVTHPGPYGAKDTPSDWQVCEWMTLCQAAECSSRFDVLHSHAYLWGLPAERFFRAPVVHTMHTCPYEDEGILRRQFPLARVTGVSVYQWRDLAAAGVAPPFAVVHHGIDAAQFTFRDTPGDYLCYLGRFIPAKGPLEAIRIARDVGMPLVLAGPSNPYFETAIRPHVDQRSVKYVGPVNRAERDKLLGSAAALLYPLLEPEPFGLVQIEAMMCGTPVVAPSIGAVPEVVKDGVSGILAPAVSRLAAATKDAVTLPRAPVRAHAIANFASTRMAQAYVEVFQRCAVRPP